MFSSSLQFMVDNVKGGYASILMGFDGIPVDSYTVDDAADIETIGMEFSVVLKEICNAVSQLDAGDATEVSVKADRFTTIVRMLNDQYFIAIAIASDGNLGKARYLMRLKAPEITRQLV